MELKELEARIDGYLADVKDFGRISPLYDQGYEDALMRIKQLICIQGMPTHERREEMAVSEREKLLLERQLRHMSDYIADLGVEDERD